MRLALANNLVPVLPRAYAGSSQHESAVAQVTAARVAVVDQFVGTRWTAEDPVEPAYLQVIRNLPVRITHFALHATKPGPEIISIAPDHAARTREYEVLAIGAMRAAVLRIGSNSGDTGPSNLTDLYCPYSDPVQVGAQTNASAPKQCLDTKAMA